MLTKNNNSQICLCFSQSSALTLTAVRLVYVFIPDGRVFGEGGPESRALRQDWLKTKRQFNNVKLKSKQQKKAKKQKKKKKKKKKTDKKPAEANTKTKLRTNGKDKGSKTKKHSRHNEHTEKDVSSKTGLRNRCENAEVTRTNKEKHSFIYTREGRLMRNWWKIHESWG